MLTRRYDRSFREQERKEKMTKPSETGFYFYKFQLPIGWKVVHVVESGLLGERALMAYEPASMPGSIEPRLVCKMDGEWGPKLIPPQTRRLND